MPAVPRYRLLLVASTLVLGVLAPSAASADTTPTVTIASPTQGSTATGIVTVTVNGDTAAPSATDSMLLMVDGVQYGAARTCVASGGFSCPVTFSWDTTGLNGSHTLEAIFASAGTTQSAPVTVTTVNPAPTVTITSPSQQGQVVKGPLTVTALGTVDLTQNDSPVSLQLLVDGVKYGLPAACTVVVATAKTCAGTFTVPTTGTSGTHTVQVTLATTVSSAVSTIVAYQVFTALKATLHKLAPVRGGKSVGIAGQITAADGGAGVGGVKVKITLSPAVGKARTLLVRTGSTGHFSVATKVGVSTTIAASVAKTTTSGTAYAVTKIATYAPITCKISKTLVHENDDEGTCVVPSLPNGTKVSLQYLSGKKWKTLGSGTTQGSSIPISFSFPKKGHFQVRVVLGASKAYLASSIPFTITVT